MVEQRTWVKIPLFLSSYFPLWLIFMGMLIIDTKYNFFTKSFEENQVVGLAVIGFGSLIIIPIVIVALLVWNTRRENNQLPIFVSEREDSTGDYVIYVVTYIIPFVVENFLEPARLFALVVMMTTIGFLYIRANYFHINPVLNILGYRLYKISDDSNNKFIILSKKNKIKTNHTIKAVSLNLNIYLETEQKE